MSAIKSSSEGPSSSVLLNDVFSVGVGVEDDGVASERTQVLRAGANALLLAGLIRRIFDTTAVFDILSSSVSSFSLTLSTDEGLDGRSG